MQTFMPIQQQKSLGFLVKVSFFPAKSSNLTDLITPVQH